MTFAKRGGTAQRLGSRAAGRPWSWKCCCSTALLLFCASIALPAQADLGGPTSDRAARDEAARAIPWRQMTAQNRRTAQFIVQNASIYRRLPTRVIDCDTEMFTFLLHHPEVVVDVWRVMGVSQLTLDKLPGGAYRARDGAGTTGKVAFLHADWGQDAHHLAVIFADGAYEGPPFVTPLKAQSVMLLRSGSVHETNGRRYITVRVDTFVRIEQVGIELVAKTVQPWIAKTADQNLIETLTFVSNFSRAAEKNPQGVERLAARLSNIDEPTRNELVALSFRTAERYAAAHISPAVLAQRTDTAFRDAP